MGGTQMMSGEWEQEPQTPNKCSICKAPGEAGARAVAAFLQQKTQRSPPLILVSVGDC